MRKDAPIAARRTVTCFAHGLSARWEGAELYTYSPLIYAFEVQDVAITGTGLIDGNEKSEFHTWRGR